MVEKAYRSGSVFRMDFLWYLLGSVVPMAVGFVKTPVFTRFFDREDFGQLGLVTITFSFLGMLLFSWISSCIWRYYNKYKGSEELGVLFSNIFVLYLLAIVISGLLTGGWYLTTKSDTVQELVIFSLFQLILNQFFQGYMVLIRLMKRSRYYTVFQSARAVAGLLAALVLVFVFNQGITALISSLVIVDALALLVLGISNPAGVAFRLKGVRGSVIRELLQYGSAGLILNMSLLSMSYSDRYIIAFFHDLDSVGVYDQVSKISQLSVIALTTVYFNTINPVLFKKLESDFQESVGSVKSFMFTFMMVGIPSVFYLSLFAKEIAYVLLGPEFRDGYAIMPYIFWGALLYGISQFYELRLKFSNRIRRLGVIALLTAAINVGMNFIFVGNFGYQWAAYTTMASYLIMLVLLIRSDPSLSGILVERRKVFLELLILLCLQYTFYYLFVNKLEPNIFLRTGAGLIFVVMYFWYFRRTFLNLEFPMN